MEQLIIRAIKAALAVDGKEVVNIETQQPVLQLPSPQGNLP